MKQGDSSLRRLRQEVAETLRIFQQYYHDRNDEKAHKLAQQLLPQDCDLIIVGTSASHRGGYEWCEGKSQCLDLIRQDWRSWGRLTIDIDGAHISGKDAVAWVAAVGILRRTAAQDDDCAGCRVQPDGIEDLPLRLQKLLKKSAPGPPHSETEEFRFWKLRWSAVLSREDSGWVFRQMHFSYPGFIDTG